MLVALWLYATCDGVGSAHELERLCKEHDAYRICGGVPMNYHALSDFRSAHMEALDELLTQLIAVLMQEGLVVLKPQDSAALRALKERMASAAGKEIYKERAATAETVNADLKTWRSLDRFLVRGTRKATCVLWWNVLAYNTLRWLALTAAS